MKAISLWQPWASLIAIGAKKIETRSWPTFYRGRLAIHAAKRKPNNQDLRGSGFFEFCNVLRSAAGCSIVGCLPSIDMRNLPLGAIVATCELFACVEVLDYSRTILKGTVTIPPEEPERSFGDYTPRRYAWLLKNVKKLDTPIPWIGRQGLFEVPDSALVEGVK